MSTEHAGLIAATGYVAGLIIWILIDAMQGTTTMNLKSALRALWHRLVPRRHKSADQLAREDLQRRLRWRVDSRLERAIRANRLALEDARAVRREYKRLAAKDDTEALTKAINYAAALAPKERAPRGGACAEGACAMVIKTPERELADLRAKLAVHGINNIEETSDL